MQNNNLKGKRKFKKKVDNCLVMEKEKINQLFENLHGTFDIEAPKEGHKQRFFDKLHEANGLVSIQKKKNPWLKPLSLVASVAILFTVGIGIYNSNPTINQQIAEIAPEVSNTQYYFASLIEEQVKQLESESTPETQQIIADTMIQLKKLEASYSMLEDDLLKGGNSKLILSAMITNFQTRIGLLQDVLNQIETIKTINNNTNENNYII